MILGKQENICFLDRTREIQYRYSSFRKPELKDGVGNRCNTQELQGRNGNETVVSQMMILWFQSVKYVSMKSLSFDALEASPEGH